MCASIGFSFSALQFEDSTENREGFDMLAIVLCNIGPLLTQTTIQSLGILPVCCSQTAPRILTLCIPAAVQSSTNFLQSQCPVPTLHSHPAVLHVLYVAIARLCPCTNAVMTNWPQNLLGVPSVCCIACLNAPVFTLSCSCRGLLFVAP